MGVLEKIVAKFAVQTVVYWGSPTNDGTGKNTFADPVEILCRWDEAGALGKNATAKELESDASIMTNEDLEFGGRVILASLAELNGLYPGGISNPYDIEGTYDISSKKKIPMVAKTDDFFRQYFLTVTGA